MRRDRARAAELLVLGALALCGAPSAAAASQDGDVRWPSAQLSFQPAEAQPADQPAPGPSQPSPSTAEPDAQALAKRVFGVAGSMWWSAGGGVCWNFGDGTDVMANVGWSYFLADELEFRLELAGWYFNQVGDNTGAVSAVGLFHWHFLHDPAYTWTVFGEIGIGLLFGFDNIPDGGTGVDFAPRIGGGYTCQLGDSPARLEIGLRWRHISNGRYEGDVRNPARDSIMVFAGVIFPF